MKIETISIAKLKSCQGYDGECFSCDLIINGKKVAQVSNGGSGGGNNYWWNDKVAEQPCNDYAASLPPMPPTEAFKEAFDMAMPYDLDMVLGEVMEREALRKQVVRKGKTGILYVSPEDKKGQYYFYKCGGVNVLGLVRYAEIVHRLKQDRPDAIFAHDHMDLFLDMVTDCTAHPRVIAPAKEKCPVEQKDLTSH